ncbi:DNA polymerase III subunit gamma/tau [Dysgonomonas sp. 216]|uniref:DNA polymerase III subunit gamma/tau n=1 Tax=Dysgonomonas sp. 216 TaxID=2302934 RepID=UPI0013D60E48|nr:DNA polymerase III subunit gamma/tau [Dysgonomonas sp. 216]NDW18278.1 DNA polymerase III subunit gamma/tau [Dysgonomonas sp. 216]NDW18646.1 DNA polymerase III subunit gamma/tau [Dysgonomonas sp. 216]
MDNYIVSARKYRPSTFRSVVGQRSLTTTLKNAIASNKLAHAYLFCGPRGVGKTTCARIFAKTINCLEPTPEKEACNKCESCQAFNEQRSLNIHELDAASNNSVDDIRSLIDQVRIPPQIGKYKVYIIDEVHMLSSAAFNAFLKTLEEPPHHAIFILATTEKHKILPTILSRCQIYDFSRISITDIVEHLHYVAENEGVTTDPEALNILAQKADGGMRDALSIFDQVVSFTGGNITYKSVIENLNVLDYEYYFKLTESILAQNVTDSLLTLNDILNRGFDGHNVITGIASHFRDLLLCKDAKTAELFEVGASIRSRYTEIAQKCSNHFLYKAIEIVNDCDLNYRLSRNKRLLSDLTLIKLCQLSDQPTQSGEEKKNSVINPIHTQQSSTPVSQPIASNQTKPITNISPKPEPQVTKTPEIKSPPISSQKVQTKMPGSLGISISAITEEKKEEVSSTENDQSVILEESFTPLELINEWKSYTESDAIGDDHHLKNTMINCLPSLLNRDLFEVVVNNQLQEQKLNDSAFTILTFLRNRLKNSHIRMEVRISVDNEKKLAFTAKEKFDLMAEQNQNLLRLKDEFGLEEN